MQELRALRVGSVLEDGAALTPCDEEAVLGDGDVQGGGGSHADATAEGSSIGAVGLADECHGSAGAADPAGSLGQQLLEPAKAVLLKAVVLWLVYMSTGPSTYISGKSTHARSNAKSTASSSLGYVKTNLSLNSGLR